MNTPEIHAIGSSALGRERVRLSRPQTIALGLLAVLLLVGTSLDYLWYGQFPLWLGIVVVSSVYILFSSLRAEGSFTLQATAKWLILPWCGFVAAAMILELSRGTLEINFSRRVILNLSTLALLLTTAMLALRVRPALVVYVLGIIGASQGALCHAQFGHVTGAWSVPETITRYAGATMDENISDDVAFEDVGRVRGSNPLVHKFNSMQGILAVFLFVVLICNFALKNPLKISLIVLTPLAVLAALGMLLTFSRSTILGGAIGACIALLNIRKAGLAIALVAFGALGYYGVTKLGVTQAEQFTRLVDPSRTQNTNEGRVNQYSEALKSFLEKPLAGRPSEIGPDELPIHSVVLRVMVDYGALGAAPYLLVMGGLAVFFWRGRKAVGNGARVLCLAGLSAFLTSLCDAWTHSSGMLLRDVAQPALIGAFVGLALGELRSRSVGLAPSTRPQRPANFL